MKEYMIGMNIIVRNRCLFENKICHFGNLNHHSKKVLEGMPLTQLHCTSKSVFFLPVKIKTMNRKILKPWFTLVRVRCFYSNHFHGYVIIQDTLFRLHSPYNPVAFFLKKKTNSKKSSIIFNFFCLPVTCLI